MPVSPTSATIDPLLLRPLVGDILTAQTKQTTDAANATAQEQAAAGYTGEIDAYNAAIASGENNAKLEQLSADLLKFQQQRETLSAAGSQRAAMAGNETDANSGSAAFILRNTLQKGALQRQITQMQSAVTQGGFLEQGAAAHGEVAAAQAAQAAALSLAGSYTSSSQSAAANATAETQALLDALKNDPNATSLVNDLTTGNLAQASVDVATLGNGITSGTLPISGTTAAGTNGVVGGGSVSSPFPVRANETSIGVSNWALNNPAGGGPQYTGSNNAPGNFLTGTGGRATGSPVQVRVVR